MISRVAEHCFWLARYLERAENTARILEVNHTLLLDFHVPVEQQWRPILIISGIHDYAHETTAENVQEYMTWDPENPCSIVSSLAAARENGRIIREVISAEMWERLNYYHLWIRSPAAREIYDQSRGEFYSQIRRINQLIHGISDATMSHGEPWEFFRLGAFLERTSQTARILDVKYHILMPKVEDIGTPVDSAHWVAVLMSCSGYEPFHKKPRVMPIDPAIAVGEFLILDDQFPRSIRRCIQECQIAAQSIAGTTIAARSAGADVIADAPSNDIAALLDWLVRCSIQDLIKMGLHEALTHIVDSVHEIGNTISRTYFDAPVPTPTVPSGSSQSQSQS